MKVVKEKNRISTKDSSEQEASTSAVRDYYSYSMRCTCTSSFYEYEITGASCYSLVAMYNV